MKIVLYGMWALVLVACAGRATAQPVTMHGLAFPDSIDGYARGETRDFESQHPGVGYSAAYRRNPWNATVFIYDLRLPSIPDDPLGPLIGEQVLQASAEINRAVTAGAYEKASSKGTYNLPNAGRARFQCADFTLVRGGGQEWDSLLCITTWRGKFIKFRVSGPKQPDGTAGARRFVEAWSKVLWP
jgi:hypothetical protein